MGKVSTIIKLTGVLIAGVAVFNLLRLSKDAAQARAVDEVRATFAAYKRAILASDGATAAQLLSAGTIDWYAQIKHDALYATKAELDRLPPIAKIQVLAYRVRVAPQQLQDLSPRQLVAYAVDKGWIVKAATQHSELGHITVSDGSAVADLLVAKRASGQYRFVKEDGQWRFDQLPLLRGGEARLDAAAQLRGESTDELVLSLLSRAAGKKVGPEIWTPPFPAGPPPASE